MARIRSIHPGIWTDDEFMSLSALARLLLFGLWNEAFDDGVFEWKPNTIKARIFPNDDLTVPGLLEELVSYRFVTSFESGGKKYGVVRNFQKFQRPKKPNSSGVLPDDLIEFSGGKGTGAELVGSECDTVPNQYGTGGGKCAQREDGGGKREEGRVEGVPPLSPPDDGQDVPSKRPAKPRGTRLTLDEPPHDWLLWAKSEGHPDPYREWDKFADYWRAKPGQGGVKVDWAATWRNWIRRAVEDGARASPSGNGSGGTSLTEMSMRITEQMRSREAAE